MSSCRTGLIAGCTIGTGGTLGGGRCLRGGGDEKKGGAKGGIGGRIVVSAKCNACLCVLSLLVLEAEAGLRPGPEKLRRYSEHSTAITAAASTSTPAVKTENGFRCACLR
eukprot:CAMPEP_0118942380 /NCGR_PEP_ID=MMETSP1169-20130426/36052_1 /TAXON_ID=36882 /ORGANISM="Pyramimonas obovata, Strain CCMP722" /LENGTH=109 /DNA_ID=CAMNT_0006887387 /DNA_START=219 /DNA_END=548 /DNA_ORIENTATION=-